MSDGHQYPDHLNPFEKKRSGIRGSFRRITKIFKKKDEEKRPVHANNTEVAAIQIRERNVTLRRPQTELLPRSRFHERVKTYAPGTTTSEPINPFDDGDQQEEIKKDVVDSVESESLRRRKRRKKRAPLPPDGLRNTLNTPHHQSTSSITSYEYETDCSSFTNHSDYHEEARNSNDLQDIMQITSEIQQYYQEDNENEKESTSKMPDLVVSTDTKSFLNENDNASSDKLTENDNAAETISDDNKVEQHIVNTSIVIEEVSKLSIEDGALPSTDDTLDNNATGDLEIKDNGECCENNSTILDANKDENIKHECNNNKNIEENDEIEMFKKISLDVGEELIKEDVKCTEENIDTVITFEKKNIEESPTKEIETPQSPIKEIETPQSPIKEIEAPQCTKENINTVVPLAVEENLNQEDIEEDTKEIDMKYIDEGNNEVMGREVLKSTEIISDSNVEVRQVSKLNPERFSLFENKYKPKINTNEYDDQNNNFLDDNQAVDLENSENMKISYVERKSIYVTGSKDELDKIDISEKTIYITGSCDALDVDEGNRPVPKIRKHKLSKSALLGSSEDNLNN